MIVKVVQCRHCRYLYFSHQNINYYTSHPLAAVKL